MGSNARKEGDVGNVGEICSHVGWGYVEGVRVGGGGLKIQKKFESNSNNTIKNVFRTFLGIY